MKKIIVCMLVIIVTFMISCSKEKEFDFDSNVLVVGMECNYAPFNWTETTKTDTNHPIDGTNLYAEGYDVMIAKEIADELGLELVIKKIEWEGLVISLKSGVIDLIIAGMSPTEDRKKSISFTNEYYSVEHVVVVRNDSSLINATKFSDFSGAKIVGQKDTIYDVLAKQLSTKSGGTYLTPINDVPAIIYGLKTSISDATILELPVATAVVASNPTLGFVTLQEQFDLEEEDKILSIGARQIDELLIQKVNEALSKITTTERKSMMDQAIERSIDLI